MPMEHEEFLAFVKEQAAKRAKMKKRPSIADQLKTRLIKMGINAERMERLRPGHWQRSSGAWVWCAHGTYAGGGMFAIGSQETMDTCLKMDDAKLKRELNYG